MSKITKVLKNIYFQKKNYFQKYKKKNIISNKNLLKTKVTDQNAYKNKRTWKYFNI